MPRSNESASVCITNGPIDTARSISPSAAPPMTMRKFVRAANRFSRGPATTLSNLAPSKPDSRIENRIAQIHNKVGGGNDDHGEQHVGLYDREIAAED